MFGYIKYKSFFKNAALFSASPTCYAMGDFFKLPITYPRIFIVNDIKVLYHILIANQEKYEKSKLYWKQLRSIIGEAMGSIEGDEWLQLRKLQNPFFNKPSVNKYLDNICANANRFKDSLSSKSFFIPSKDFSNVYVRIILNTIFGVDEESDISLIHQYIENGEYLILRRSQYPWRPYFSKFTKIHKTALESLTYLQKWTNKKLEERKKNKSFFSQTLMDALVEDGRTKEQIRNELIIHLGAGTETAAVSSMWTLYCLCKNPCFLNQVQQEIDSVITNEIQPAHIENLIFLEQCIKESLRIFPPSHAIIRDAVSADYINAIEIKKGDSMYISVYGIHHNPKYWENPEDYNPERFSKENEKKIINYTYIPFGAGKHTCIGRYMAIPMMKACLAALLKKYHISLLNHGENYPIALSTLKSSEEIKFKLTLR